MERAVPLADALANRGEFRNLMEVAGVYGLGDSHYVLWHHSACTQIEVPHLAVSHLVLGESDREA